MNNAGVLQFKRSRGRPRKNLAVPNVAQISSLNNFSNAALKRKSAEQATDEIQILGTNGLESLSAKKAKEDFADDAPKRLLPHRAARFTESYGGTSPDVVVISDEDKDEDSDSDSDSECSLLPSPVQKIKSKEELEELEALIDKLKKELSDEEMKLVLLCKLKESQKAKDSKRESNVSPSPSTVSTVNNTTPKNLTIPQKSGIQIQSLPSKQLLSCNKYTTSKREVKQTSFVQSNNAKQSLPLPTSVSQHIVKEELNKNIVTSSQQLKSNPFNQFPLLKNLSNQITITQVPAPASEVKKEPEEKIDAETIYQRQAAAKLALRKQLEKTLLQIPLPKRPPLKLNFFPNPNSIEFFCLLGLDYVVDFITKSKKNNVWKEPLRCVQCSIDFTCSWKWKEVEKNGKKTYDVFCEACINSNVRKALKAQHTNNLKAAFLKALQQEKEIDRLAQTIPKSHSSTRESRPSSRINTPSPAHQTHHTASAFSVPKTGSTISYIPKPAPPLNHTNMAQMNKLNPQFQSILQAQAQHLLASGVPLHPNVLSLTSFVPPSSHHSRGKPSTGQNDIRRNYRSDRVQSPSIPQASSSWKS
ncbi:transcriptional repressor p66 alpha-like [Uloborus diversus]|uniref:transcriptional repressor p66 alpha-like n=1 Tax=Uloborus diversus TaxID=327109 RepID=UPI002409EBC9|nr:transcriptional repressor p66 alpha-like [Uloborus diversus]XP_054714713.1 transcriptional repressor p66 alpha-like [Uloborus diversus]XP_054714714.1 transcriptional repressor p66 alpha-like [Uloborus diversus]